MTKQRKYGLILFIIIVLSGGAWLSQSGTAPSDKGYELYLTGDTEGAFRYFSENAEKDPQAAYALAMMYLGGTDIPGNSELGQQWLLASAQAGNKSALYNLGFYRYRGLIKESPDDLYGIDSLKKSAQAGVREAQELLGSIYLHDKYRHIPSDIELSRKYMTDAKEQGSFIAKLGLGYIAYQNDKDYKKAVEILTPLLSEHFTFPAMLLAGIYEEGGNGIAQDLNQAEKYKYMALSQISSVSSEDLEPQPLSLYGSLTQKEVTARRDKLETLAKNGNTHARYTLFYIYADGDGVIPDKEKALTYLQPLIDANDPKAMYVWYVATRSHPDYLKKAADAGYPDALFMLYQVYANIRIDYDIEYDTELAKEYLKRAADTGHRDAMMRIIDTTARSYGYPDKETNKLVSSYLAKLLEKYPQDPAVLMLASERYGDDNGHIYDPVRAFEFNKKAAELSPDPEYQDGLAYKYGHGIGIKQDLKKSIEIYKSLIRNKNNHDISDSYHHLTDIYFTYDGGKYIDEKEIIAFLKEDVDDNKNYRQAYFYADILLRDDPVKNRERAMELYGKAREYTSRADIHQAKALIALNTGENNQALKLVLDVLDNERARYILSPKEWNDAAQILFSEGKDNAVAKNFWVYFALTENNPDAIKLIEPLIGHDPAVSYYYALLKLTQAENQPDMTDEALRPSVELMLTASGLGSSDADEYIISQLKQIENTGNKPVHLQAFLRITGLSERDIVLRYKKCADAGSIRCMYELGEIYVNGNYGEKTDPDIAIAWYEKVPDKDYRFTISRLRDLKEGKAKLAELNALVQKGNAEAAYSLAYAWRNGNYGLKSDHDMWLKYLKISADGGYNDAMISLIDNYSETDTISATDKTNLLHLYEQLADAGEQNYTRKLAAQYLSGSNLVSTDRQKARHYFAKAGREGKYELGEMDKFDRNLQLAGESPDAAYQLGYALLTGNGTQKDQKKSVIYLRQAAQAGHDRAAILLSDILTDGKYDKTAQQWIVEPDLSEAVIWLRQYRGPRDVSENITFYETTLKPALSGDNNAILALGQKYQQQGNNPAAQLWFGKSAETGYVPAFCLQAAMTDNRIKKQEILHRGAEKGDICSEVQLAALSLSDPNFTPDSAEWTDAVSWLEKGIKNEDPAVSAAAFTALAGLYSGNTRNDSGNTFRKPDNEKYLAFLQSVADQRADAQIALFFYYRNNNDIDNAIIYLKKAHDGGDISATELLYTFYMPSKYCEDYRDADKAALYLTEWLKRTPHEKNRRDRYTQQPETDTKQLGDAWLEGYCNIDSNPDNAIAWYKTSLEYHSTHALSAMYDAQVKNQNAAEAYYYGLLAEVSSLNESDLVAGLSEQDRKAIEARVRKTQEYEKYGQFEKETEVRRQKAENGNAGAAFSLAVSYARGETVPEDTTKMLYYYEIAGKNGYARAYNTLGNLYRKPNERGIVTDGEKALSYFDAGAKLGDSNTAHLAGDMLYFGQTGLKKDYARAAQYYDMTSLEQGDHHSLAKYKLALIYYNKLAGTGSDDDLRKARDNLLLAAKYGDKDAIQALKEWDFSRISGH
ncbi:SEL1-like repeat protein [Morganella psychrotolerans]|uniref:Sel1 repeat family protein n=2 Tax=Morganella psychrotolerans TaxID=368603 RepID=A0A5M9QYZ9_9GAMM|nr:SEL1-like repeat protein [Morganella psychrotolerans]KAA8713608.1 sel1 repeat family protein [Morganella psychrotolerans]